MTEHPLITAYLADVDAANASTPEGADHNALLVKHAQEHGVTPREAEEMLREHLTRFVGIG